MDESRGKELAINGAPPARRRPDPPMYPGGMAIDQEEEQAVLEVLRSKRLFRFYGPNPGPSKVDELERAFAAYMGVPYAQAVTSGTASLITGLHAIGVGPGDEVIVPAYTWIASATAVIAAGAVPIIAEVDETLTLDPADVAAKISPYTKAIMPVHMRGAPCQMEEILAVAQRHGLRVIEDTAQADGASYRGKHLGTLGDVGCFSLQFNKIITCGEGGMVVTHQQEVWERAHMYHDVVGPLQNKLPMERMLVGVNYRMPELTAAVALVQLRRLDGLLAAMRERKHMLRAGLEDVLRRKGLRFQASADPAGDAGICLIFFAHDAATAGHLVQGLRAEQIGAGRLYEPDRTDYHVYAHWVPILEKRTWSSEGGPWRWARRQVTYSADMCPRSLDLLGRAVHLNVSPLLSNDDIEETLEGATRVIEAMA